MNWLFIGSLILATLLTSCSLLENSSAVNKPSYIELSADSVLEGDKVFYTLTAPPVSLQQQQQMHLIAANYGDESYQFIAQVEYGENTISLVAISLAGIPLFDFKWQKDGMVIINQYVPIEQIDINHVVADVQWAHWPIEQLQASTKGKNIEVKQFSTATGNKELTNSIWKRVLMSDDNEVLSVEKFKEYLLLSHKNKGYSIKVTSLKKGQL